MSRARYLAAAQALGLELPPWMGEEGEFEHSAKIINSVNKVDRVMAQKLWYYLISTHLDFDQMSRLGMYMAYCAQHDISTRMSEIADGDKVSLADLGEISLARERVTGALNLLAYWVRDADQSYSSHYKSAEDVEIKAMMLLFCLPWNIPEIDEADFWGLLLGACEWIGRLGVGAVGVGEPFTILVNYPGLENRSQLKLRFVLGSDRIIWVLQGFIPCPDTTGGGYWAKASDMEPEYISMRAQSLPGIQALLNLTPQMSSNEIEAAFSTLSFSAPQAD